MPTLEKFRYLEVWKKSHLLTLEVYKITEKFPKTEMYGLISQMRRSTLSVVANVLNYLDSVKAEELTESSREVGRMLSGLIKKYS